MLGVAIDNKLFFDEHIIHICKTANKKPNALSRINHYMKQHQKETLLSSFIISHLSYCPLIWMFCSKQSTKKINAVHERSLWIIRNDYESLYPPIIRRNTPNNISLTMYKFSCDRSLQVPEWTFTWHYQWYFQVKRKYVQSPKLPYLPDRKSSFIEIRTWCYFISR